MILKLMNLSLFEEIANIKRHMNELVPEEDKMATIPSLLSCCDFVNNALNLFFRSQFVVRNISKWRICS